MVRAFSAAHSAPRNCLQMCFIYMVCAHTLKGTLIEFFLGQLQKDSKIVLGFMCPINCAPIDCKLIENVIDNRGT